MAVNFIRIYRPLHPLHAFLLGAMVPLYMGAMFSDIAYTRSYQIQWVNFSSWLIAGALVFNGLALLWALVGLFRPHWQAGLLYFLVLLAAWILGFFNALMHARDAWASMPAGLILSVIVTALAIFATFIGFSGYRVGGIK